MTHIEHPCGNPECSTSTGIHEGLTFGNGELDEFGYWNKPCRTCAEAFDKVRHKIKAEMLAEGRPEETLDWLDIPGWPFGEDEHG